MAGLSVKKDIDKGNIENDQEIDSVNGEAGGGGNLKLIVVISVIAVIAIAIIVAIVKSLSSPDEQGQQVQPAQQATSSESGVTQPAPTEEGTSEESFVESDPNYKLSNKNKTTDKLVSEQEFVKDLTGKDVQTMYSVQSRDYITTHVSYVAKRAAIDEGMELYWLDVEYKKKKYRVQVPFYYFKDLDDEGIVKVEIEVLNLEGGGQIISYMQVVEENSGE